MQEEPGAQRFRNAPGLGETAGRSVRGVAVEDFAEGAEAAVTDVSREPVEQSHRMFGIAMHAVVRDRKRAKKPRPYGSLVVSGVALGRAAAISCDEVRVGGRE